MQIEWFHYFLETAKLKSLSKASERLNMTQPALSKLIRHLESELQVTLFERTVTGVELTAAGVQLQERIVPLLDEFQVLLSDLRSHNGFQRLQIGVLPSLAAYYLPGRMASIKASFPDTQLVVESTSEELLQHLQAGDVQAVIASPKSSLRHLWNAVLLEEPYYCVFSPSSPLAQLDVIRMADIARESLVVYPPNCDVRGSVVRNYAEHGLTPNIALEIPFSESILAFVGAGSGITIAPEMIAEQAVHHGLRAARIVDFHETRQVSLAARSEALGKLLLHPLRKG